MGLAFISMRNVIRSKKITLETIFDLSFSAQTALIVNLMEDVCFKKILQKSTFWWNFGKSETTL